MPTYTTGAHLKELLEPMLVKEFKNDKDDFIGRLKKAPKAAIDTDGIKMNKLVGNVTVEINANQAVGEVFTPTQMPTEKGFIPWDNVDTHPTFVNDEEARALPFDKRAEVRVEHMAALKRGVRDYVLHKYAPADDTDANLPVLRTTGDVINGRKRLTLQDLIEFRTKMAQLNLLDSDHELICVLNPLHVEDLSLSRINLSDFGAKVVDIKDGKLRRFFGFNMFENNACPFYAADNTKKAIGATTIGTDQQASVIIYRPVTVFHRENVKVLYKPETLDTRNVSPQSEFRLKSYLLAESRLDIGHGAIVSDNG